MKCKQCTCSVISCMYWLAKCVIRSSSVTGHKIFLDYAFCTLRVHIPLVKNRDCSVNSSINIYSEHMCTLIERFKTCIHNKHSLTLSMYNNCVQRERRMNYPTSLHHRLLTFLWWPFPGTTYIYSIKKCLYFKWQNAANRVTT